MSGQAHKGRGAVSAPAGRFANSRVEPTVADYLPDSAPETVLRPMQARQIISRNDSPDIPFDRSINPYQGCEHGCVYCYARPSHSYLDLSPGIDFETQIFYKPNAAENLLEQWSRRAYVCQPITIGANTDPYQPAEKSLRITRALLETFLAHRHPVSLITKSGLMTRDLDILAELARHRLVNVAVSIPTANDDLKRILEPRVPAAKVRFSLMASLREAGVPVSLLLAPVIPAVTDAEIESIVARAAQSGATNAGWVLLRLPHELKEIFRDWLNMHMPDRAAHVMSLVQQAGGGRDYDNRFGIRQRGRGPYAAMLGTRFRAACARHGLITGGTMKGLDCSSFVKPGDKQLTMAFD